jgi:hypothetical protein
MNIIQDDPTLTHIFMGHRLFHGEHMLIESKLQSLTEVSRVEMTAKSNLGKICSNLKKLYGERFQEVHLGPSVTKACGYGCFQSYTEYTIQRGSGQLFR